MDTTDLFHLFGSLILVYSDLEYNHDLNWGQNAIQFEFMWWFIQTPFVLMPLQRGFSPPHVFSHFYLMPDKDEEFSHPINLPVISLSFASAALLFIR